MKKFLIGEFSRLTGLGIHTLRYYEKENLLKPQRNAANRRYYTENDLAWVEFIRRLKETNMPIKDIKHYARLREQGESTLHARREMLLAHRQNLDAQIRQLLEHKKKLNAKIEFYNNEIKKISLD